MNTLAEKAKSFRGSSEEAPRYIIKNLEGPGEVAGRLRELGFTTGESVRVLGVAPLGEPLMVEVRGAIVALRKVEAACIQI